VIARSAAAALLALLLGCGGGGEDPGGGTAAAGPAPGPVAAGAAAPAAAAAGEGVDPAAAALSKTLQAELEKFTPRKFKSLVAVATQTREGFRKQLEASLDKELPAERERGTVAAFVALGLLPPGIELRKEIVEAVASQVGAYYERTKDTFYPISTGLPEAQQRLMFIHELQHAMQDQVLGLDAVMDAAEAADDNTDRVQAARYLLEGEAHWVSLAWLVKDQGQADVLVDAAAARKVFRDPARLRFDDALAQMRANIGAMGPDGAKQLAVMERLPRWIIRELQEPYTMGAWSVHRIYAHGGWPAVDAVWSKPPTSTEQMLHPLEKLLGKRREEPVAVTLPDCAPVLGAGWERVYVDTFGEAGIHMLLSEQLPELKMGRARSGSAGWGGDRLAAWSRAGAERPIVTWLTVWDSEKDAVQFVEAYGFAAAARNGLREWPAAGLLRDGLAVAIVEGEADPARRRALLDALVAAAPKPK
jgi:hypothetical protein